MGKPKKIVLLLLLFLALVLASPLLVSRVQPDGSMLINGSGDNLWHISLSAEIKKGIPPSFPGISGEALRNYHYFSDALWGIIGSITGLPLTLIYFQLGSVVICSLLVWQVFRLAKLFLLDDFWSVACVITTLFVGSAAFVKPLFIKNSNWSGNAFMLDQPYDQLINLHTGIGYILIVLGTSFVFRWLSSGALRFGFLAATVLSILFGVKIFFALPMALAFGIICLLQVKRHNFRSLLPGILLLLFSTLIYLLVAGQKDPALSAPLSFRPGWLLTKMVEDTERFNLAGFYLKYLHYQSKGNWLRLAQMEGEKVLIYILGNFWLKLLGAIYLVRTARKRSLVNIFLSLCILISISLPLFITPKPDPFNAVQFGQVAIILMGFTFGLYLSSLRRGKLLFWSLLLLTVFILSRDFFNDRKFREYVIPKDEYSALEYLKHNTDTHSVIMVDPVFDNKKMKVTALAERRTFYTGGQIAWLLGIPDSSRQDIQLSFFAQATDSGYLKEITRLYGIDYIYASSSAKFDSAIYPLVYSNPSVSIYHTENLRLD